MALSEADAQARSLESCRYVEIVEVEDAGSLRYALGIVLGAWALGLAVAWACGVVWASWPCIAMTVLAWGCLA